MAKAKQDRAAAVVAFLFAASVFYVSRNYLYEVQIFPRLIAGIMMLASIIMFIRSFVQAGGESKRLVENPRNLAIGVAATFVYVVSVRYLGFFLPTAVLIPAMAYALGLRQYKLVALTAVLFLAAVQIVFVRIFGMTLPKGIFANLF